MKKFNPEIYKKSLTFDLPIEYNGLIFTPVKVEDYDNFNICVSCLLQDKDSVPDVDIIKMSYLDYLFYLSTTKDNSYILDLLIFLIEMCTGVSTDEIRFYINDKNEHILIINGKEFDKNKFMYMREIICHQNDVDLSMFDLDPRVRYEIKRTILLQSKNNMLDMATLEEQIICVMIITRMSIEDISKLSIRKFNKIINRTDLLMNYVINNIGIMSGNIASNSKIMHWLNTLEKNKLDKLTTSYEEVQSKVKMSNMGV